MRRANPQHTQGRFNAAVVLTLIALVLLLSFAVATNADHGLYQFALALPVFFVLAVLAELVVAWLHPQESFVPPQPHLFASHTRAPPV